MFGKIHCWIIRMLGGKHAFRRLHVNEWTLISISSRTMRICDRCGKLRPIKAHAKKEAAS